jgi:hypothetical protein
MPTERRSVLPVYFATSMKRTGEFCRRHVISCHITWFEDVICIQQSADGTQQWKSTCQAKLRQQIFVADGFILTKTAVKLKERRKYTLTLKRKKEKKKTTDIQAQGAESITCMTCCCFLYSLLILYTSTQNMQTTSQVKTLQKACSLLANKQKTTQTRKTASWIYV